MPVICFDQMSRKRIVRLGGDVREHPRYSIEEAATYLKIPASTMKAWTRGQHYKNQFGKQRIIIPVITLADPVHKLLSFYNLAEAHILRATRERKVPLQNVRRALFWLQQKFPVEHPLLTHDFMTSGKELFIDRLGSVINATAQGQTAMRELLEKYLNRIERDKMGMPVEVVPIYSNHLAINPRMSSGQPVIRGSGIMISVLINRRKSGESVPQLARDYGLEPSEIETAIQEYAAA